MMEEEEEEETGEEEQEEDKMDKLKKALIDQMMVSVLGFYNHDINNKIFIWSFMIHKLYGNSFRNLRL
mgnify:CR=1 FL=1